MTFRLSRLLAASALTLAAGLAHAGVDQSWSLTSGSSGVNVSAWTASNTTNLLSAGTVTNWSGGVGASYSGEPTSSPQHALDNHTRFESLLLDFGSEAVNLSKIGVGWSEAWANQTSCTWWGSCSTSFKNVGSQTDLFVLAYTGSDPFSASSMSGLSYSQLLNNGWEIVANVSGSTGTRDIATATPIYSSFWLIGAGSFEATSGGAAITTGDGRHDFIKIAGVTGSVRPPPPPGTVAEPGSLALLGLGMLGMLALRRRRSV